MQVERNWVLNESNISIIQQVTSQKSTFLSYTYNTNWTKIFFTPFNRAHLVDQLMFSSTLIWKQQKNARAKRNFCILNNLFYAKGKTELSDGDKGSVERSLAMQHRQGQLSTSYHDDGVNHFGPAELGQGFILQRCLSLCASSAGTKWEMKLLFV